MSARASPKPLQTSPLPNANGMPSKMSQSISRSSSNRSVSSASGATKRRPVPPANASTRLNGKENIALDGEDAEDEQGYTRMSRDSLVAALRTLVVEKDEATKALDTSNASVTELQNAQETTKRQLGLLADKEEQYLADQARLEEQLAKIMDQLETTQVQAKDADKARRDLEKQMKDQADSFDTQRANWLETQSKFESRIAMLSKAADTRAREAQPPTNSNAPEHSSENDDALSSGRFEPISYESRRKDSGISQEEVAETIEALVRSQTALAELQGTHELLQERNFGLATEATKMTEELAEMRETINRLMDENESFTLLLGERTLNGAILGQGVFAHNWDEGTPKMDEGQQIHTRQLGGYSSGLGLLPEEDYDFETGSPVFDADNSGTFEDSGTGSISSGAVGASGGRRKTPRNSNSRAPTVGLDLAAELDRANDAATPEDDDMLQARLRHGREGSSVSMLGWNKEKMESEIRNLKDANKALSIYINKILERVIAQEGFENVLATDYRKSGQTSPELAVLQPSPERPKPTRGNSILSLRSNHTGPSPTRASFDFGGEPEPSTPIASRPSMSMANSATSSPANVSAIGEKKKASRLSLSSIAASAASLWSSGGPKSPPAQQASNLKPMLLNSNISAHTTPHLGADSIERPRSFISDSVHDDEEDARERQRLQAELKLLGIDKAGSPGLRPASLQSSIGSVMSDIDSQSVSTSSTDSKRDKRRSINMASPRFSYISTSSPPSSVISSSSVSMARSSSNGSATNATITAVNLRDQEIQRELKAGRPSGFTEPPKRVGSVRRRESSQASSTT